ncbi:toprim domain-containing protein [Chryseobacterium mulctrae]|uniref:toprim domain-containing protein n=1 Tax=Chryseobacterium mulctrae TaxID=2576777 RepID=UPI001116421E|nr:toprim domain-containing protein [Chryseobacterium mulctrae]
MNDKPLMINWDQAMNEINLMDFFVYKFPNFFYDKSRDAFVDNLDPKLRTNKFQFGKGKDGRQNYFVRGSGTPGNLIHFIKNFVVQHESKVWEGVNRELIAYKSNLETIKQNLTTVYEKQKLNEDFRNKMFTRELSDEFILKGKFYPIHQNQKDYVTNYRQISIETLNHPLFQNIVKSFKDEKDPFFTLAFEIKDTSGKVVGVQKINTNPDYDNFNSKRFVSGTQNDVGFGFSNTVEIDKINLQVNTKQGGRNLFVTESLWDAMAHFEVNKPQNAEYISTNGEIGENKAFKLKQYFELRAFEKITLATDNDKRGSFFDTIIISSLIPEIKINYKDTDFLSISLSLHDKESFAKAEKIASKFKEIDKKTVNFLSDVLPRNMAIEIINQEMVISYVKRNSKSELEFIVPNTKEYLESFNNLSLQIFPGLNKKISIQKSISKDWNDDLKLIKNNKIENDIPKKKSLKI